MRVALIDPSGFTPQYDHELAAALMRSGADVELVTSRFRFGPTPVTTYRRTELFYPLSSRLFKRSRVRLPLKLIEHLAGLARLRTVEADVFHVQWLAVPQLDGRLMPLPAPAVLTAHDVVPRSLRSRPEVWRRVTRRFDRIVVHSERGRVRLAELGIEPERLRVVPHPVFSSYPTRNDDGRTILCLGLIRDYKGLDDSIAVARHFTNVRLLVAGDPMEPVGPYRRAAGEIAEWRLGYLSEGEVNRALGEATLALFPYRAGIDQSGALMRTLGAGVASVVYDIGSLGDCVRRFGAGRVVPPGDIKGLVAAVRELLEDPVALELARAGARRARDCLTWEAAAAKHLEIYRELAPSGT